MTIPSFQEFIHPLLTHLASHPAGVQIVDAYEAVGDAVGVSQDERAVLLLSGTRDGGIDGIISVDKLGLQKVYVQAKRWQGSVSRPELQAFFGALAGRRASKGVFITTSRYTREAEEFARDLSESIVIVDGKRLDELMIEHGVGVSHKTLRIPQVDGDYFEEG